MRKRKEFRRLRQVLLEAEAEDRLKPEQRCRALKALDTLQKVPTTRDRRTKEKVVDQIARLFVEVLDNHHDSKEEDVSSDD